MDKKINDKNIKDLNISKPAKPESVKGAIKNPAVKVHLDLCHFDIPMGPDDHFDVPHSDTTWNDRRNVELSFKGSLRKDLAVKFAGLGATIDKNKIVLPADKVQEYEKLVKEFKKV